MRRGFVRTLVESSRKAGEAKTVEGYRLKVTGCFASTTTCLTCNLQPLTCNKLREPTLRFATELHRPAPPLESQRARVQRMIPQDQLRPLFVRQSPFHQRQIQIHVAAVNLVAHDGMPDMREVDADLVFATRARKKAEERKTHLTPARACAMISRRWA